MSEHDLIQGPIGNVTQLPAPAAARRRWESVIARDRLRVRLLAAVTALLWLGGIAAVTYTVFCFNRFVIAFSPPPLSTVDEFQIIQTKMDLHHSLNGCMLALPVLLLAALCTVRLVMSSRRATLNQINLSLTEISTQLQQLRSA